MNVLLTGFEPFGGDTVNPSAGLLHLLDGWRPGDETVVRTQLLPCVFGDALRVLDAALERERPALVIALGQAATRCELSLERVAINVDDARIPDNAGRQPIDTPVVDGGPAAYFSTLPIKAIVAALRDAGIPAAVSQTAGTFVCNHVFYGLMHRLAGTPARGGFMHLPPLPKQAAAFPGRPSMALKTMAQGVRLAIATALATSADVRIGGGTID